MPVELVPRRPLLRPQEVGGLAKCFQFLLFGLQRRSCVAELDGQLGDLRVRLCRLQSLPLERFAERRNCASCDRVRTVRVEPCLQGLAQELQVSAVGAEVVIDMPSIVSVLLGKEVVPRRGRRKRMVGHSRRNMVGGDPGPSGPQITASGVVD